MLTQKNKKILFFVANVMTSKDIATAIAKSLGNAESPKRGEKT